MNNKERIIKRLKSLKQYQNSSFEELEKLAIQKIEEKELLNSFVGLQSTEIKKALELYNNYTSENSFESLAEKTTLTNLVYLEILKERMQLFIKKEGEEKEGAIPLNMTEKVLELDTQIMTLKEKLGMLKDKNTNSPLEIIKELKEKALKYYEEHAGETYVKCPYCLQLFRLLAKIDNLEPTKAVMFKGTTIYNQKLMELYHNKKLTIEEIAEILGVHSKYVIFIYENIYLKELKHASKN